MSTLAELTACYLLNDYLPKTIIDTIIEPYLLFQDFSIVIQQNLFREYALCERFFLDPFIGMWYTPFFDISELVQQLPTCDYNCVLCQHAPTNTLFICGHQSYHDNELGTYISEAIISRLHQYEDVRDNNGEYDPHYDPHYLYLSMREVLWRFHQPSIASLENIDIE
jgi:hypothetical protein